ncbi:hypothetical protein IFU30_03500 [Plantibacter sp. CFBP 8798]|uniref:hypothetical protein n=1 Tax=Plantibacter sp. CFBP 8798 TaxID=2775268 RepID=UPI0017865728|nr:hypothetical protein [Plantibacter sp. CFBP 8798]MBD8465326.1 hypothetical protein [Plantibacter sp. CFBP 8798]
MRRRRFAAEATSVQQAESVREGIYVAFTSLSVVLILAAHAEPEPAQALFAILVTGLGTVLAALTADVVAHLVVHDALFTRPEFRHACRSSLGALIVVVVPVALLLLASFGALATSVALWGSAMALVASLVIVMAMAIRGTRLSPAKRALLLGAVGAGGLLVIGLQVLAHG